MTTHLSNRLTVPRSKRHADSSNVALYASATIPELCVLVASLRPPAAKKSRMSGAGDGYSVHHLAVQGPEV